MKTEEYVELIQEELHTKTHETFHGLDTNVLYGFLKHCKTPEEMVYKMLLTYPVNSTPYQAFRYIIEDKWLKKKYPTEYVAVFKRWSPYPAPRQNELLSDTYIRDEMVANSQFIPRWHAEFNPYYIQWVVGGIIHTGDGKQVFLRSKEDGPYKDKITLIQGHASFQPSTDVGVNFMMNDDKIYNREDVDTREFELYLCDEFRREAKEEANVSNLYGYHGEIHSLLIPPKLTLLDHIDYFHIGVIFNMVTDQHSRGLYAGEPDKSDLVIVEDNYQIRKEFFNDHMDETDRWVLKAIRKF